MGLQGKGKYGYIETRRKLGMIRAALGLAVILAVYFAAAKYFGTNRNVFTIIAALLCIPEGMWIVNLIMFLRAKGCSAGARSLIEIHDAALPGAYDLYLTGYEKSFQLSHAAAADGVLCAYTEVRSADLAAGESHIARMLEEAGHTGYDIRIYNNLEQYLNRLDELEKVPQNREAGKAVLRSLLAVSL